MYIHASTYMCLTIHSMEKSYKLISLENEALTKENNVLV